MKAKNLVTSCRFQIGQWIRISFTYFHNIFFSKNRCELPQMHLLSVAMENNLHKTCPPNCQDMLVWLPYTVTLKILMYLDPGKLTKVFPK